MNFILFFTLIHNLLRPQSCLQPVHKVDILQHIVDSVLLALNKDDIQSRLQKMMVKIKTTYIV